MIPRAVPELGSVCTWHMVWRTVTFGAVGVELLGANAPQRRWTDLDQWLEDYLNPERGDRHGTVSAARRGQ